MVNAHMLNVIMLNVIVQSVVILNAILPSVMVLHEFADLFPKLFFKNKRVHLICNPGTRMHRAKNIFFLGGGTFCRKKKLGTKLVVEQSDNLALCFIRN